jgi:hypothetical protein
MLKSFFYARGQIRPFVLLPGIFARPFSGGIIFAVLTTDRLSHSRNRNAFLFLQQMNMEMEMCFHFIILQNWQRKQKCVSISFVILCNWLLL